MDELRWALVDDIVEGLIRGEVARAHDTFRVERRDDGSVLEVDLGDPDGIYLITLTTIERLE